MTTEELKKYFEQEGISIIPILGSTDQDEVDGLIFDGDLPGFISAMKKLQVNSVFLIVKIFDESDISGDFTIRYEDYVDCLPITQVYPKITSFKTKIGEPCEFRVLAKGTNFDLNLFIIEEWWEKILLESIDACRKVQEKENLKFEEEDKKFRLKKSKVLKDIGSLLRDDKFIKLPTQRAMIAYAEENIEDIFVLEDSELKQEIQKLNDRLVARGFR